MEEVAEEEEIKHGGAQGTKGLRNEREENRDRNSIQA